jgi:hypothetical protein
MPNTEQVGRAYFYMGDYDSAVQGKEHQQSYTCIYIYLNHC